MPGVKGMANSNPAFFKNNSLNKSYAAIGYPYDKVTGCLSFCQKKVSCSPLK